MNLKQCLTILNCKLGDDTNSSEDVTVMNQIMAEDLIQNTPLLKPLVHSFLTCPHSLGHSLPLHFFGNRCQMPGTSLSIGLQLHTHRQPQLVCKDPTMSQVPRENIKIIVCSGLPRSTNPANVSSQNRESYLITKTRPSELVREPISGCLRPLKISTIHTHEAVICYVAFVPVIK